MKSFSPRQKLFGGVFGLVAIMWGIDMLTGNPEPSPASAASSSPISAAVELPLDPVDIDALVESLHSHRNIRAALPFEHISRDLFVPTPAMAIVLNPPVSTEMRKSEPREQPAAEPPPPFEAQHTLQGVLTGRIPLALVDDLLLRRGAELDGYRLVEIRHDFVVFQRGRMRVVLSVAAVGK